jgi:hypothetical protein
MPIAETIEATITRIRIIVLHGHFWELVAEFRARMNSLLSFQSRQYTSPFRGFCRLTDRIIESRKPFDSLRNSAFGRANLGHAGLRQSLIPGQQQRFCLGLFLLTHVSRPEKRFRSIVIQSVAAALVRIVSASLRIDSA